MPTIDKESKFPALSVVEDVRQRERLLHLLFTRSKLADERRELDARINDNNELLKGILNELGFGGIFEETLGTAYITGGNATHLDTKTLTLELIKKGVAAATVKDAIDAATTVTPKKAGVTFKPVGANEKGV